MSEGSTGQILELNSHPEHRRTRFPVMVSSDGALKTQNDC